VRGHWFCVGVAKRPSCPALTRSRALLRLRSAEPPALPPSRPFGRRSLAGPLRWRIPARRTSRMRVMASVDGPPAWRAWASLIL